MTQISEHYQQNWGSIKVIALCGLMAVTGVAYAGNVTIPNSFSAGDNVSSSKFNENFDAIEAAVDDNDQRIGDLEADTTQITNDVSSLDLRVTSLETNQSNQIAVDCSADADALLMLLHC